jgi:hypothetical protein
MILIYILLAAVGMVGHWLKKWGRGEITVGLWDYIRLEKKHTVGAVVSVLFGIVSWYVISTPVFSESSILIALLTGFTGDSIANKAPIE